MQVLLENPNLWAIPLPLSCKEMQESHKAFLSPSCVHEHMRKLEVTLHADLLEERIVAATLTGFQRLSCANYFQRLEPDLLSTPAPWPSSGSVDAILATDFVSFWSRRCRETEFVPFLAAIVFKKSFFALQKKRFGPGHPGTLSNMCTQQHPK